MAGSIPAGTACAPTIAPVQGGFWHLVVLFKGRPVLRAAACQCILPLFDVRVKCHARCGLGVVWADTSTWLHVTCMAACHMRTVMKVCTQFVSICCSIWEQATSCAQAFALLHSSGCACQRSVSGVHRNAQVSASLPWHPAHAQLCIYAMRQLVRMSTHCSVLQASVLSQLLWS